MLLGCSRCVERGAAGKRMAGKRLNQVSQMTIPKVSLSFLILTLGITCAYAKKQPKGEEARQLSAEQAALVQKAIEQEKVLIENIQLRTPLVETYIQDMRPDVKLYEVPVGDHYMLSRVNFGKGFFAEKYQPKKRKPRRVCSRTPSRPLRRYPRR